MAGCWIGVMSADHAAEAVREGVFACSHGKAGPVARPALGDRFAYYAPRERPGAGAPVQAFVALGTITDEAPSPRDIAGLEVQVRRAAYEPVGRAPVRPLLADLAFTRNRGSHWGVTFRRGIFTVSAEDFARIAAAMREAAIG